MQLCCVSAGKCVHACCPTFCCCPGFPCTPTPATMARGRAAGEQGLLSSGPQAVGCVSVVQHVEHIATSVLCLPCVSGNDLACTWVWCLHVHQRLAACATAASPGALGSWQSSRRVRCCALVTILLISGSWTRCVCRSCSAGVRNCVATCVFVWQSCCSPREEPLSNSASSACASSRLCVVAPACAAPSVRGSELHWGSWERADKHVLQSCMLACLSTHC